MLSNEKVFYKIESDIRFTEVQFMGDKKMVFHLIAEKYPEKLKIMDMLDCVIPYVEMDPSKAIYFEE